MPPSLPAPPPHRPHVHEFPTPATPRTSDDPTSSGTPQGLTQGLAFPDPGSSESTVDQRIAMLEQLRRRSDSSYEGNPACDNCRRRKTKCDRQQPICGRCAKLGRKCTRSDVLMRRGPPSNKERAAYQAAGIEIPSLKYRHRTRRAQSLAQTPQHTEQVSTQQPVQGAFLGTSDNPAVPFAFPSGVAQRSDVLDQGSSSHALLSPNGAGDALQFPSHPVTTALGNPQPNTNFPAPPLSERLVQGALQPDRGVSADYSWIRDNRRGYYAFDDSHTGGTAAQSFAGAYSPVTSTSSEPSYRRWSLLPPGAGFGSSTTTESFGDQTETGRLLAPLEARDSLSSTQSLSPSTGVGSLGPPQVARFSGDPYYLAAAAPYEVGETEPSPASSGSYPPVQLGSSEALASGVVTPNVDERSYYPDRAGASHSGPGGYPLALRPLSASFPDMGESSDPPPNIHTGHYTHSLHQQQHQHQHQHQQQYQQPHQQPHSHPHSHTHPPSHLQQHHTQTQSQGQIQAPSQAPSQNPVPNPNQNQHQYQYQHLHLPQASFQPPSQPQRQQVTGSYNLVPSHHTTSAFAPAPMYTRPAHAFPQSFDHSQPPCAAPLDNRLDRQGLPGPVPPSLPPFDTSAGLSSSPTPLPPRFV